MSRSGGGERRRGGNGSKKEEEEEEGDVCLLVLLRCHQWRADGGRHSRHPIPDPSHRGVLLSRRTENPNWGKIHALFFGLPLEQQRRKE
jgi:hypothetical protein